jgi:hypothetical protein
MFGTDDGVLVFVSNFHLDDIGVSLLELDYSSQAMKSFMRHTLVNTRINNDVYIVTNVVTLKGVCDGRKPTLPGFASQ